MQDNRFHFLDVQLTQQPDRSFHTSVFIKPTDTGIYSDYRSHIPDTYKKSLVKTLVNRALKYCTTWEQVDQEIKRIQQAMANSGYPQFIVDNIINQKVTSFVDQEQRVETENITFFVELHNLCNFQQDKKQLKGIVQEHVKAVDTEAKIKLQAYFKPYKLSAQFSTRPTKNDRKRADVVYQFNCSEDGCNATYIGYTTCTLERRSLQHRYNPSSIFKHYQSEHNIRPPTPAEITNHFKILHSFHDLVHLRLAEALAIKEQKPFINIKYNEMSNFLNLYR